MTVEVFAPGRVNVIGEHTDYNDGLALPFAIDRGVTVVADVSDDGIIEFDAADLGERDRVEVGRISPAQGWAGLPRAVAAELAPSWGLHGARLRISSTLPQERGLSSSAGVAVAIALALLALDGRDVSDRVALARLCARAEERGLGVAPGLLDPLAILLATEGNALRIDFRDLTAQNVPLQLDGWCFAVADSGERRSLAASGYGTRREECASVLTLAGRSNMRDVTRGDIARLPRPLSMRAQHVLDENERVDAVVDAVSRGDGVRVGELLDASHRSLRDLYEVSTPAVEATVSRLREAGAAGARLMGGGFGGSVLALFPPRAAPPPDVMMVAPADGARVRGS